MKIIDNLEYIDFIHVEIGSVFKDGVGTVFYKISKNSALSLKDASICVVDTPAQCRVYPNAFLTL